MAIATVLGKSLDELAEILGKGNKVATRAARESLEAAAKSGALDETLKAMQKGTIPSGGDLDLMRKALGLPEAAATSGKPLRTSAEIVADGSPIKKTREAFDEAAQRTPAPAPTPTPTTGTAPPPLPTTVTPPPIPAAAAAREAADATADATRTAARTADEVWGPGERALRRVERAADRGLNSGSKRAGKSATKADDALENMEESLKKAEEARNAGNLDKAAKFEKEAAKHFADASKHADHSSKLAAHFAKTGKDSLPLSLRASVWGTRLTLGGVGFLALDKVTGHTVSTGLTNLANTDIPVLSHLAKPASWAFQKGFQAWSWVSALGADALSNVAIKQLEIKGKLEDENSEKGQLQREIITGIANAKTGNFVGLVNQISRPDDNIDIHGAAWKAEEAYKNCTSDNLADKVAAAFEVLDDEVVDKTLAGRKTRELGSDVNAKTTEIAESTRQKTTELAASANEAAKKSRETLTDTFDAATDQLDGWAQFSIVMKQMGTMLATFLAATIMPIVQRLATTLGNATEHFAKTQTDAEQGNVASLRGSDSAMGYFLNPDGFDLDRDFAPVGMA